MRDDGVEQTVELVDTADVPLWQYHLAAGRDADDLLTALWASVPR